MIRKIGILSLVYLFLFPMISLAEYSFELIPRFSVSQIYDDNIYLDNTNEKSDNLTTVSPGIRKTYTAMQPVTIGRINMKKNGNGRSGEEPEG